MRIASERLAAPLGIALGLLAVDSTACAGFQGLVADQYAVVENGQTYCIVDLYVDLDVGNVLTSVFGASIWLSGETSWFHADPASGGSLGGTWMPSPSATNSKSDSFVTIGGAPAAYPDNATLLAPTFQDGEGGNLGTSAGWFNSNPNNLSGLAADATMHDGSTLHSAVMIGRFSVIGVTTQTRAVIVEEAWFQWSSTPFGIPENSVVFGGNFQYVPSPGAAVALLGGAPLLGRGRRRLNDRAR